MNLNSFKNSKKIGSQIVGKSFLIEYRIIKIISNILQNIIKKLSLKLVKIGQNPVQN